MKKKDSTESFVKFFKATCFIEQLYFIEQLCLTTSISLTHLSLGKEFYWKKSWMQSYFKSS